MSILEALIFGIVQGISEFLPVSSSAHIVITQIILGYELPSFGFEIFLHIASLFAVIIYYRHDLIAIIKGFFAYLSNRSNEHKTNFYFGLYILIATIITGGLGIILEDFVGTFLKTPPFIAIALAITGIFLIIIDRYFKNGRRQEKDMTFLDSIIIGLVQTLAVMPGISRSGSTLIAGLFVGLTRETALRFSFLLSIPVILGSSVLAISDLTNGLLVNEIGILGLTISFISTLIFSWLGIVWLISLVRKSKLTYFAIYCIALAIFVFFFLDSSIIME